MNKDFLSPKHRDDLLKKRVSQYNKESPESTEFKRRQKKVQKNLLVRRVQNAEDKRHWFKFCSLVYADKEENRKLGKKTHFSFDYIEKLGIEYDLLLVYGGKNIGKTYSLAQEIKKIRAADPKAYFAFIRNMKQDVTNGLREQFEDDIWPFELVAGTKLVEKVKRDPDDIRRRRMKISRTEIRQRKSWGFATHISGSGLTSYQGGQFKNLRLICWDECNDEGDGTLTTNSIRRFLKFVLSMERDDRNKMKIIMTGNLLRHHSGLATNVVLDSLGIPYDTKLKVVRLSDREGDLKILYINTGEAGDLFDGVDSQKFLDVFGEEAALDLKTNQPASASAKTLDTFNFVKAVPVFSFVFKHQEATYIVYLAKHIENFKKDSPKSYTYYILHTDYFSANWFHFGYKPVTDDASIANQFGAVTLVNKNVVARYIRTLFNIMKQRILFFSRDDVRAEFSMKLFNLLDMRYKETFDKWH